MPPTKDPALELCGIGRPGDALDDSTEGDEVGVGVHVLRSGLEEQAVLELRLDELVVVPFLADPGDDRLVVEVVRDAAGVAQQMANADALGAGDSGEV